MEEQEQNSKKSKKSFRKIVVNLILVLIVCVFALLAFVLISGRANNKVPFIFNKSTLWVLSDSMEGVIPQKSYILISKVNDAKTEIKEGDIITFYSQSKDIYGQLNTHQVVEINYEKGYFITKGVNCPASDADPVPFDNVVGKYEKNLKLMSALGRFYSTSLGFIVTTLILAVLVGVIFLPDVIRAFKKSSKDNDDEKQKEIDRLVELEVERLKQENLILTQQENAKDVCENPSNMMTDEDGKSLADNVVVNSTEHNNSSNATGYTADDDNDLTNEDGIQE